MVKTLKILLVLVLLTSFFSCYEEVELIKVGDYSIGKVEGDFINIHVNAEINNPNKYNIKIKKTALDLFVDKKNVGQAKMTNDIVLKKKTQDTYQFTVKANYKKLSGSLMSSLKSLLGKSKIKLGIKGRVKAKAFGLIGKKFDLDMEEDVNLNELMRGGIGL